MIDTLPLPSRLAAIARAIGRGDYSGLRTMEREVFAFARQHGLTPAELIRSWAHPNYAKSAPADRDEPEPDDNEHPDDSDDNGAKCGCTCAACVFGHCDQCDSPTCTDENCAHEPRDREGEDGDADDSDDDRDQ